MSPEEITVGPTLESKERLVAGLKKELEVLESLSDWASSVPMSVSCVKGQIDRLENEIKDIRLELQLIREPVNDWLRVPSEEVERLGLSSEISEVSWRSHSHYYLELATDAQRYLAAREAATRAALYAEEIEVGDFPHLKGIMRLDDWRSKFDRRSESGASSAKSSRGPDSGRANNTR